MPVRIPPCLTDSTGKGLDLMSVIERYLQSRHQVAVPAVDSDQRPGVKDERRHRIRGPWLGPFLLR